MSNGWAESAAAWIASQGEDGDFSRAFVLDEPMLARAQASGAQTALDVGCGEGRFCRMLRAAGIATTGLDPTTALLDRAKALDPAGTYVEGLGEALPFADAAFDLVVSYLSLVDIPDLRAAIQEMARVARPGGTILVANVSGFNSARVRGPATLADPFHVQIDHYFAERAVWEAWKGIRVLNHHRPLSAYMQAFLAAGLQLSHFDEPMPTGGPPDKAARYARVPWHLIMEWRKPA